MPPTRIAKDLIGPLIIVAATLLVFGPLATAEFTSWDDWYNIWKNPRLNPPTLAGVARYWSEYVYGLYIPLTYSVWGVLAKIAYVEQADPSGSHLNPWVFHGANIAFHAAGALAVFGILRRLVGGYLAVCLGALLFALHPVQVESVGWCAGMKDVLSGTLGLAAIWLYLRFVQEGPRPLYAIATATLVAAMLAKPSAMVVPVMAGAIELLLLRRPWRDVIRSLGPWLVLSIACAINAKIAQPAIGVTPAPLWSRPLIAADALAFYLYKLVWPMQLGIDYGRTPQHVIQNGSIAFTWVVPVALGLLLIRSCRRAPALGASGIVFVAGVAPVLGLTTFLFQHFSTTADHYLYLAMLGPAMALAWTVDRFPHRALRIAVTVALGVLAARSMWQTRVWQSDVALFENALRVNPNSFMAMHNLAHAVGGEDPGRAEQLLTRAVEVYPNYLDAHEKLADLRGRRGDIRGSLDHRIAALEIIRKRPRELQRDVVPLLNAIALDWIDLGEFSQARRYLDAARGLRPTDPQTLENFDLLERKLREPATAPASSP